MKLEQVNLPFEVSYKKDLYEDISDSNGYLIAEEVHFTDANYIIEACNNFPEAIRLLKESREKFEALNYLAMVAEIDYFLTKLEEDENI